MFDAHARESERIVTVVNSAVGWYRLHRHVPVLRAAGSPPHVLER
jgi:hypothetical protein